jgi:hypothetical protein
MAGAATSVFQVAERAGHLPGIGGESPQSWNL